MAERHSIRSVETPVMPHMHVSLYHDRGKLQRDLSERGIEPDLCAGCDAQTFTTALDGADVAFVLMDGAGEYEL